MPNIVGEAFLPYVVDQINTRQKILGKPTRDSRDLAWEIGKTSWVKLASSINIASETITAPDGNGGSIVVNNSGSEFRQKFIGLDGQNYGGNRLASELILQGGALLDGVPRFGITQTNSILPSNPSSYGLGGTEFGIQPMPGITSFSIKSYNNGTLREATLSIQANNRKQFEYIDTLYLRLGYTMFVEWGNTSYPISITPSGEVTYATGADIDSLSLTDTFISAPNNEVNKIPFFQNLLEENRKKSKGNYDGFVGIVKNFSWEFNKDGTYTINLILISAGSVIESLKINNQVEGISYATPSGSTPADSTRASALATFIDLASNPKIQGVNNVALKKFLTSEEQNQLNLSTNWLVRNGVSGSYTYPILSCNAAFGQDDSTFLRYVHFGSLLSFISKKLLTYDPFGESNFISIDYNSDTYVYSNGWSVSSDPKKLIVGFYKKIDNENCIMFRGKETNISQFHSEVDGIKVGRLMNVYFEQQYLKEVITNNQDPENGGVFLDKFLNILLNDINVCLGNVNKLKYRVNQVKVGEQIRDVIQFYDEVSIFGKEKLTAGNYDYTLNLYGFHQTSSYVEGSFVTDYGLKTEISKRLQTQIAIGAQAGGQAVGFDSTAISKWNVGLVDRINPVKLDSNQVKKSITKNYNDFIDLSTKYVSYLKLLKGDTGATFDTTTAAEDRSRALTDLGKAWDALGAVSGSDIAGGLSATGDVLYEAANTLWAYVIDPIAGAFGADQVVDYGKGLASGSGTDGVGEQMTITNATAYVFPKLNLNSTEGENQWSQFQSIQSTFFSKVMAGDALAKGIATPFIGFLPINFTVTLDGISGIRIFDKLQVDSRFLPPNYGETLEFVITGLDHKIENNKWVTTLETTSLPKISGDAQVLLDLGTAIEETLEQTEVQRQYTTDEKIPDTPRNRQVVEQIIVLGKRFNYNDYQRQFAIITVALAESGLNPFAEENFNYSLSAAKSNFSKIRALSDEEALTYIPRGGNRGGSGSQEKFANFIYGGRYGNGENEGYKYRGSGLTQITFKSNYKKMDENLTKYGYPVSSFFPNNPNATLEATPNLLRNGSAKAQELAVAILIVGKVAGQFGKKLSPSTDYINGGINNIIQTQNGGTTKSETSPSAINYGKKRNIVKNTEWVFELFKKYDLLDNTYGTEKTPLTS